MRGNEELVPAPASDVVAELCVLLSLPIVVGSMLAGRDFSLLKRWKCRQDEEVRYNLDLEDQCTTGCGK